MNALDALLAARPSHCYVTLPSRVVLQLRRVRPEHLRAAGVAALTGLSDASELAAEAEAEAKIAAGMVDRDAHQQHEATKAQRRLARLIAAAQRNPDVAVQLARNLEGWAIASVVGLAQAADEVAPGVSSECPPLDRELVAFRLVRERSASDPLDVQPVDILSAVEVQIVAAAAQRHASAKEALPPVVAESGALAGV